MTLSALALITALRALPRYVETEVETGIGMFPETQQTPDGPWISVSELTALLDQFEQQDSASAAPTDESSVDRRLMLIGQLTHALKASRLANPLPLAAHATDAQRAAFAAGEEALTAAQAYQRELSSSRRREAALEGAREIVERNPRLEMIQDQPHVEFEDGGAWVHVAAWVPGA